MILGKNWWLTDKWVIVPLDCNLCLIGGWRTNATFKHEINSSNPKNGKNFYLVFDVSSESNLALQKVEEIFREFRQMDSIS